MCQCCMRANIKLSLCLLMQDTFFIESTLLALEGEPLEEDLALV